MNRVLTQTGDSYVIVVAPHGFPDDDLNTDVLAEVIACELEAYSVVNVGWRRGENAVVGEGIANLNSIKHCVLPGIKPEFLDPLLTFKQQAIARYGRCCIFYIHGMADLAPRKCGERVDMVLGYGAGDPPSYTCDLGNKNALVVRLRDVGFSVYQSKPGGRFSAWKPDNLNQLFRQEYLDTRVHSIQIEVAYRLRSDVDHVVETGLRVGRALGKLFAGKTTFPMDMKIGEY